MSVDTAVSNLNKAIKEHDLQKKVAESELKTLGYSLEDKLYTAIKELKEFKDLDTFLELTKDPQMPRGIYLRLNVPLKDAQ